MKNKNSTSNNHDGIKTALSLIQQLRDDIVIPVSGGIPSVYEPFLRWIASIEDSLYCIKAEADQVYDLIESVELGIRFGYDFIAQGNWKVPSDTEIIDAMHDFIVYTKKRRIST